MTISSEEEEELNSISDFLQERKWRKEIAYLIPEIPSGHLISYGQLAKWGRKKHNLNVNARNVAWLRRKMYSLLGHPDTEIELPLHRIACKGDNLSVRDSDSTQEINRKKREREDSWPEPQGWYSPSISKE